MNNICIIPARAGSKRVLKKNIIDFHGKPMISWPIEISLKSQLFDKIIVSTDSEEIASIAKQYGADIPFLRPSHLSDDYTPTRPVIIHAIEEISRIYNCPDNICCIYPTSSLLVLEDLIKSYDLFNKNYNNCDFVFSVTKYSYPIQRSLKINKGGRVEMNFPEFRESRSQDLKDSYHDAGLFYWGKTNSYIENKLTFSEVSLPYIIPNIRVKDIDNVEDLEMSKIIFSYLKKNDYI